MRRKPYHLHGMKFGRLSVVGEVPTEGNGSRWLCECDCGRQVIVTGQNLRFRRIKTCGCGSTTRNRKWSKKKLALTGQKFYKLTVLHEVSDERKGSHWLCQCDCGNEHVASGANLRKGLVRSCGCLLRKHGLCHARSYSTWKQIMGHSENVCAAWHDFAQFYRDMGDSPSSDYQIRRKDTIKPYSPENCFWGTRAVYTYQGKTQSLRKWAQETGINLKCLEGRIVRGWSLERALTTPVVNKRSKA